MFSRYKTVKLQLASDRVSQLQAENRPLSGVHSLALHTILQQAQARAKQLLAGGCAGRQAEGNWWGYFAFFFCSWKKSLQATVRAATSTTNSLKSTSLSLLESRSFMIFSTNMGSFWDCWERHSESFDGIGEGNTSPGRVSNTQLFDRYQCLKCWAEEGTLTAVSGGEQSRVAAQRAVKRQPIADNVCSFPLSNANFSISILSLTCNPDITARAFLCLVYVPLKPNTWGSGEQTFLMGY